MKKIREAPQECHTEPPIPIAGMESNVDREKQGIQEGISGKNNCTHRLPLTGHNIVVEMIF